MLIRAVLPACPKPFILANLAFILIKWSKTFERTRELFRNEMAAKRVSYGTAEGDTAGVCFEVEDVATAIKVLQSQATVDAMAFDGVVRGTARIVVLDEEVKV